MCDGFIFCMVDNITVASEVERHFYVSSSKQLLFLCSGLAWALGVCHVFKEI